MAADTCDLIVIEDDAGVLSKLIDAWVYLRENGTQSVLRSNANGDILAFAGSGDATRPSNYTRKFFTRIGAQIEIFTSRGAKPLPNGVVTRFLQKRQVELGISAEVRTGPIPAQVTPGGAVNSLRRIPLGKVKVPPCIVGLTSPAELSLWTVLLELLNEPSASGATPTPLDPYYTQSFPQGAAWVASANNARAKENAAAPAVPDFLRPRERGVKVSGFIAAGAQVVRLSLLDASGNPIQLRPSAGSSASVPFIRVAPQAASGKQRGFNATLFFSDAANAFGPVQLLVESEGLTPPVASAFAGHLVGVQVALLQDDDATAGAPIDETADIAIIDYTDSPAPAASTVIDSIRVRRMAPFAIAPGRQRNYTVPRSSPARTLNLIRPEMPLWMAEAQLVGIQRAELEDLMTRRLTQLPNAPSNLRFSLSWDLRIQWDGPDSKDSGFSSRTNWSAQQQATLALDSNADPNAKRLAGVGANGDVPAAFNPAATALSFPGPRRAPTVLVDNASRAWGRHAGAASRPALVFQWQPSKNNGQEEIHGGDGLLSLLSLQIDGQAVDAGLVLPRPTSDTAPTPDTAEPDPNAPPPPPDPKLKPPAANSAIARVPTFRVRGQNPSRAQLANTVDALVADHIAANRDDWLSVFTVAEWQDVARRVCGSESGFRHFANVPFGDFLIGVRSFGGKAYGKQRDMSTFGPPHGYGLGQRDPPGSAAVVFDYLENARECVRLLMKDKAQVALADLRSATATINLPTDVATFTRLHKNLFLRATVRRYNGGREFAPNAAGTAWDVSPSIKKDPTIFYCDNVLGTSVPYETLIPTPNTRLKTAAAGPATATSIPFTSAMFIL